MNPFVILTPPRAGSTSLVALLHDHEDVVCRGELLGENAARVARPKRSPDGSRPSQAELLELRARDPELFMSSIAFPSDEGAAAGFKILYGHVGQLSTYELIERTFATPGLRVVHLWRRNLVARAVSEMLKRQETEPPSPARVAQRCRSVIALRDAMRLRIASLPQVELCFEHLLESPSDVLGPVWDLLGVRRVPTLELPRENTAPRDGRRPAFSAADYLAHPDLSRYLDVP